MKALLTSIWSGLFERRDRLPVRDAQAGARRVATVWGMSIARGERLSNGEVVVTERYDLVVESAAVPSGHAARGFELGERVQIRDECGHARRVTTVRALIWEPSSELPAYYQVDDGSGKMDPRYYRPHELEPLPVEREPCIPLLTAGRAA